VRLNRTYYQNLAKSLLIVIAGVIIVVKEANPMGEVTENYFTLLMLILSAFFGFIGLIVWIVRINHVRYRRKFIFSLAGVSNACVGGISLFYGIRHHAGLPTLLVFGFSLLVGASILYDIFFGKRAPRKFETEMLSE